MISPNSKIFRVIEFKDKEHAKKAIDKMHKFKVGDREIVVREASENYSYCYGIFVPVSTKKLHKLYKNVALPFKCFAGT